MERLAFWVEGTPVPQGSKAVSRQGFVFETNAKKLRPWRTAVSAVAKAYEEFMIHRPAPVDVGLTFVMPRPKATPKSADPPASKRPDLDKLIRAVLDALTGHVFEDDSQVTSLSARKRIALPDEQPGVYISITP